jgi:hypothetical protein
MNAPDTPLAPRMFERLPEVYRQRDAEQLPAGALEAYVDAIDSVFRALRERVEAQYDDLFIETCDDWVVPYIADLVGTSHLKGDARLARADVARTVHHRRRKGTLGAVESQVHALSGWAVHAVELRERLAWTMHLNHLRPDHGGTPPWRSLPDSDPRRPVRGGTAALRAPAWLSFAGTPFDPFARTVDLKPPLSAGTREGEGLARAAPNLPNLGVFLWRLVDYQVACLQPAPPRAPAPQIVAQAAAGAAPFAVRFELHPQGDAMVLFNTHRYRADDEPPNLADADAVPGPMSPARLTTGGAAAHPAAYVAVATYAGAWPERPADDAPGLVLHLPEDPFAGPAWTFRGANLCAWEAGLARPLAPREIAIDPERGRLVVGVPGPTAADFAGPLAAGLRASVTHGSAGPVGAQPVARLPVAVDPALPAPTVIRVHRGDGPGVLAAALANLADDTAPRIVEIADSGTHELDLDGVSGIGIDGPVRFLRLGHALTIRALDGERPVIRLAQPLRLRPAALGTPGATPPELIGVRLQGLYLTRSSTFPAGRALVEQAAVNALEIDGCTLDPGGATVLDGTAIGGRGTLWPALRLAAGYGLSGAGELDAFAQVPQIRLTRTIAGALRIDRDHELHLHDCIVDAGAGVGDATASAALAIGDEAASPTGWGPPLAFEGLTVFGASRVERARGAGAIFVHRLQVHDHQDSHGALAVPLQPGSCIRLSWLRGEGDRLPPHFGCVFGSGTAASEPARLAFTAERFGAPGYAQLAWASDRRVREAGPGDDAMGAFGFVLEAHKWKNVGIRLREFMPVGVRALLVPVT